MKRIVLNQHALSHPARHEKLTASLIFLAALFSLVSAIPGSSGVSLGEPTPYDPVLHLGDSPSSFPYTSFQEWWINRAGCCSASVLDKCSTSHFSGRYIFACFSASKATKSNFPHHTSPIRTLEIASLSDHESLYVICTGKKVLTPLSRGWLTRYSRSGISIPDEMSSHIGIEIFYSIPRRFKSHPMFLQVLSSFWKAFQFP